jgi:hypothetical protein
VLVTVRSITVSQKGVVYVYLVEENFPCRSATGRIAHVALSGVGLR